TIRSTSNDFSRSGRYCNGPRSDSFARPESTCFGPSHRRSSSRLPSTHPSDVPDTTESKPDEASRYFGVFRVGAEPPSSAGTSLHSFLRFANIVCALLQELSCISVKQTASKRPGIFATSSVPVQPCKKQSATYGSQPNSVIC